MATVRLEVDDELLSVLREAGQPVERAALELIVMELYRRHVVSRGWAAARLDLPLREFLLRAGELGIPFADYTEEEWAAELRAVEEIVRTHPSSRMPVP